MLLCVGKRITAIHVEMYYIRCACGHAYLVLCLILLGVKKLQNDIDQVTDTISGCSSYTVHNITGQELYYVYHTHAHTLIVENIHDS